MTQLESDWNDTELLLGVIRKKLIEHHEKGEKNWTEEEVDDVRYLRKLCVKTGERRYEIAAKMNAKKKVTPINLCACMGPIGTDPYCPCAMEARGLTPTQLWTDADKARLSKALDEIFDRRKRKQQ